MAGKPLIIKWSKFAGLNNRVMAYEVPQVENRYTYKPPFLSKARNVDIDSQQRVCRRPGYALKLAGSYQDIFAVDELCLAVKGGDLVRITLAGTTWGDSVLRANVGNSTMYYCYANERIYYSNGVVIGYVTMAGTAGEFTAVSDIEFKVTPFAGKYIQWFKGRLYVARDNVLWFTDPLAYRVDLRKGFKQLPANIQMIAAVDNGIFVSDERTTYFIQGDSPEKATLKPVEDATKDGAYLVVKAGVYKKELQGNILFFATKNGICVGMGNGDVKNLTGENYDMPDVGKGRMLQQSAADREKLICRLYN